MNDLKLLYINSNYKLEIKSKYPLNKDNIDKYLSIIFKHKEVIEIEEKNNLYYLSIKDGFKKNNLYYFSIKSEDVSFVEFNNSKIILKIKEEKEELPSYWTNYLDEKIELINDKMKNYEYAFIHFTDMHIYTNNMKSPAIIKYLMDNTKIDDIIFNGDIITYYGFFIDAYDELIKFKEAFNEMKYVLVYGNHDSNAKKNKKEDFLIPLDDYKYLVANNSKVKYVENKMYGIYEINNIKFIILDTGADLASSFDDAELAYLREELLNTESDKHVIVLAHKVFIGTSPYVLDPTIEISDVGYKIINCINEVKDKMKAKLVMLISGHNHTDYYQHVGFNALCRTCDASYFNASYDCKYPIRIDGTINEQAIDVVLLNTITQKIEIMRIGCGDKKEDLILGY